MSFAPAPPGSCQDPYQSPYQGPPPAPYQGPHQSPYQAPHQPPPPPPPPQHSYAGPHGPGAGHTAPPPHYHPPPQQAAHCHGDACHQPQYTPAPAAPAYGPPPQQPQYAYSAAPSAQPQHAYSAAPPAQPQHAYSAAPPAQPQHAYSAAPPAQPHYAYSEAPPVQPQYAYSEAPPAQPQHGYSTAPPAQPQYAYTAAPPVQPQYAPSQPPPPPLTHAATAPVMSQHTLPPQQAVAQNHPRFYAQMGPEQCNHSEPAYSQPPYQQTYQQPHQQQYQHPYQQPYQQQAPCSVANPHAAPIYSAPASLGAQHSASQSPVGQPPVHSPPARHASLREQPVQRPQAYPEQQRPYSVHVPREGREDTRAPDPAYTRHQPAAAAAAVATARGSRQPCGQGAPEGCYGTYVQQRDAQVQRPERLQQAAVAALVGSMGALSVSQQQRQQQLLAASQPTLVGSAITMPMPHRRTPPAPQPLASAATIAGAASSATLVRAQGSASASAMPQPRLDGPGLPVWAAINASAFPAYQHRVAVPRSSLGGTKYAVVVGINYYGMEYSQTANINSAHTIRDLLMRRYGYREQNIVLLSDDQKSEKQHPTHRNITGTIRHVMGKVRPNDAVFFYFCGLGRLPVQLSDRRTEVLGSIRRLRSDYLLPCDFESAGAIDAAYLHRHLVHQLPPSVRLTALLNCIISETGLGVPYKHTSPSGAPVVTNAVAGCNLFEAGVRPSTQASASFGDLSQRVEASLVQQQRQGDACAEAVRRIAQSSGDIIVFGWDRDYANPKHRHFLSHTPSTQLGGYWAAAMESSMRARGGAAATFGDVLRYMQASTSELLMLPFIASGRRISLDDTFMI